MKTELDFQKLKKHNPKEIANKSLAKKVTQHKPVTGFGNETNISQNRRDIDRCAEWWHSLRTYRDNNKKNRDFANGKQWNEVVYDPDTGRNVTEENYIKSKGRVPRTQNVIKPIINNVIGQFLNNDTDVMVTSRTKDAPEEEEIMSNAVQTVHHFNRVKLLDSRLMETLLHGGLICQRLRYKFIDSLDESDIEIENVNVNRLFFNTDISDPRGNDLRVIGMINDMTIDQAVMNYATTKEQETKIRDWYRGINDDMLSLASNGLSTDEVDRLSFTIAPLYKCRVIEVWEKQYRWLLHVWDEADGLPEEVSGMSMKEVEAINADRISKGKAAGIAIENIPLVHAEDVKFNIWHGRILTPDGYVLWEGDSPYEHKEHPFIFIASPLIDGEVRGFVEDLKSSQKGINRNMQMLDFIISVSGKGALMVAEGMIPDTMSPKEFADQWSRFDGVIVYVPKPGVPAPYQVSQNSTNIGINELLSRDIQFLQDISGVHSAIQGKTPASGTPSSLYAQEAQNASLNILNYLVTFDQFLEMRDIKIMKMIKQFYTEKKMVRLVGKSIQNKVVKWDSDKIRSLEYSLIRSKGQNTPAYKMIVDERLSAMLNNQQITVKQYLQMSGMPFADKLLQIIEQDEQKAIDLQGSIGQVQQAANPKAMQMLGKQQQMAA